MSEVIQKEDQDTYELYLYINNDIYFPGNQVSTITFLDIVTIMCYVFSRCFSPHELTVV